MVSSTPPHGRAEPAPNPRSRRQPRAPGAIAARSLAAACGAFALMHVSLAGCAEPAAAPTVPARRSPTRDAGDSPARRDAGPEPRPSAPRLPAADAVVSLPLGSEAEYLFAVSADLGRLDVHFSVDTTQSIRDEIDQLQRTLAVRVVPELRDRVEDVAFGVSRYEDFPAAPFGLDQAAAEGAGRERADTPFRLLSPLTRDPSQLARALNALDAPLGQGGDLHEASAEALFQIATGEGYRHDGSELIAPFDPGARRADGTLGGVGFREGALHVVVHITDAPTHQPGDYESVFPGTHSLDEAIEALKGIEARVIGIASGECDCDQDFALRARGHLQRVAHGTGALMRDVEGPCPTGIDGGPVPRFEDACPLVFGVNDEGDGLADTVSDAIVALLDGIRFDEIDARTTADPIGFVDHIEASLADTEFEAGSEPPTVVDRLPEGQLDGVPETFTRVRNRTRLGFRVVLRNHVIAPLAHPQAFRVVLVAASDGLLVAERVLRVLVPAKHPDAGGITPLTPDEDAGR